MIPELGKYAVEVSLAYAGSLGALLAIIWFSVLRANQVKRALDEAEARWKNG